MLTYRAELDFACLYSLRRPKVARAAALAAIEAARKLSRPDLILNAYNILAVL